MQSAQLPVVALLGAGASKHLLILHPAYAARHVVCKSRARCSSYAMQCPALAKSDRQTCMTVCRPESAMGWKRTANAKPILVACKLVASCSQPCRQLKQRKPRRAVSTRRPMKSRPPWLRPMSPLILSCISIRPNLCTMDCVVTHVLSLPPMHRVVSSLNQVLLRFFLTSFLRHPFLPLSVLPSFVHAYVQLF